MSKIGLIDYYAVDHTPSYLWESASRSISAALLVHLPTVLEGREAWNENETIRRAVVIDRGVIQKPEILSFQRRTTEYPHEALTTGPTRPRVQGCAAVALCSPRLANTRDLEVPVPRFEPGDTLDLRVDGLGSQRRPCR